MDAAGRSHADIAGMLGFPSMESVVALISKIKNRKRGLSTRFDEWRRDRVALSERYLNTNVSQTQLARVRE